MGIADLVADEVVEEPHRRGGTVEALALKDRVELILLAREVKAELV